MFHLSIPPFPLTPSLFTVSLVLLCPEYHVVRIPHSSVGKESACIAGNLGSILGLGRSPGEGNDNPLQFSCQENPMDRGAWQATVHGPTKSQTRLSMHSCTALGDP